MKEPTAFVFFTDDDRAQGIRTAQGIAAALLEQLDLTAFGPWGGGPKITATWHGMDVLASATVRSKTVRLILEVAARIWDDEAEQDVDGSALNPVAYRTLVDHFCHAADDLASPIAFKSQAVRYEQSPPWADYLDPHEPPGGGLPNYRELVESGQDLVYVGDQVERFRFYEARNGLALPHAFSDGSQIAEWGIPCRRGALLFGRHAPALPPPPGRRHHVSTPRRRP